MVILNWRIRRPRLLFASFSSPRLSIYTFRFRTTPPSLPSPPPLSFILSTFLRHDEETRLDTAHDRVTPRGVPLEKSTPKIWSGEKEKERRRKERERDIHAEVERGVEGWNPKRERAGSLTSYRRAPSRNALPHPDPHPGPHPRPWKKNSATPNDFFFLNPIPTHTNYVFKRNYFARQTRGFTVDVNGPGRTGCRVANEKYRGGEGGERKRDALPSFFLSLFLPPSLSFFIPRTKFRENSTAKNGSRISLPVPSVSRDDARPDYEMLNDTATAPAARYSSKFYSFWQLARPKRKPPPREHAAAVLGQRVAAARPYEAILLILFISNPLPRLRAGFSFW